MNTRTHRRSKFMGASVAILMLSLGGLTASISAMSTNETISEKDAFRRSTTTVARTFPVCTDARGGNGCPPRVKNGVMRTTTTKVPSTIPVCAAGQNCKPKVKNGVVRSTTTNVPQTIAVCQGGGKNCNKPKRNP